MIIEKMRVSLSSNEIKMGVEGYYYCDLGSIKIPEHCLEELEFCQNENLNVFLLQDSEDKSRFYYLGLNP